MSSRDEGFGDNLMIYNWAISKEHNYEQVYPSDDMELQQLLTCESKSEVETTVYEASTFKDT